jgi:hypothetical protein
MLDEEKAESVVAGFMNGRSLFFVTNRGWNVSARATGTEYWRDPDLN